MPDILHGLRRVLDITPRDFSSSIIFDRLKVVFDEEKRSNPNWLANPDIDESGDDCCLSSMFCIK